jgi:hypothetical protein
MDDVTPETRRKVADLELEERLAKGARSFTIMRHAITLAIAATTTFGGFALYIIDRSDQRARAAEEFARAVGDKLERYEEKNNEKNQAMLNAIFETRKDVRSQYKAVPNRRFQPRLERQPPAPVLSPPTKETPVVDAGEP